MNIYFSGICFVSLSHFPVALSFHLNFYVLHYSLVYETVCFSSLPFFSFAFRSICTLISNRMRIFLFFCRFILRLSVFILRIEFEFYLLRKINGLYRCHNSHKILSIHFSTVALFPLLFRPFAVLPLASSQCTTTDDVIIGKCVKRKYSLFGSEAKFQARSHAHQTTQRLWKSLENLLNFFLCFTLVSPSWLFQHPAKCERLERCE